MSYRYIHNFPDTADLLGWYEVVYEDGFVETVPVRFGWNILPLTWGKQSDVVAKGNAKELSYAYAADASPVWGCDLVRLRMGESKVRQGGEGSSPARHGRLSKHKIKANCGQCHRFGGHQRCEEEAGTAASVNRPTRWRQK